MDRIKLFIVDDEPMAIEYFKSYLAGLDQYELVGEAYDGRMGYELIREKRPDIIFVDISMPVMDGLTLAEQLLKDSRTWKIILLSSYREFDYAKKGLEIGITSYLLKHQITQDILAAEIEKAMGEVRESKITERKLFHYNFRKFLLSESDSDSGSDLTEFVYKKAGEFLLLDIVPDEPVLSPGLTEPAGVPDWEEAETYERPGIACKGIMEMETGRFTAILFLKPGYSESQKRECLLEFAALIQKYFHRDNRTASVVISRLITNFYALPKLYRELMVYGDRLYLYKRDTIIFQSDMVLPLTDEMSGDIFLELLVALEAGEDEAVSCLEMVFQRTEAGPARAEFCRMTQDIIQVLRSFMKKNKIQPELCKGQAVPYSVRETRDWMIRAVKEMFQAIAESKNKWKSEVTRSAIYYMEENYSRNISLWDIAAYCGVSESYLRKKFKLEMESTVVDYLTILRIDKAKVILKNKSVRVVDIHKMVGFTSSQYFSNVFKKVEGISPSDYRNQQS